MSEDSNTKKPRISLIAAISQNGVIGNENKLLWHITEDMKRFKNLTSGHPIIMGRKTYESIGRPLPNRTNIIVTRDKDYQAEGCIIVHSVEEALSQGQQKQTNEVFIIGGGQIYQQSIPFADKLYLTIVHKDFTGDTTFPEYKEFSEEIFRENKEENGLSYSFVDLAKK